MKIAEPQGEVTKPLRVASDSSIFIRQDLDQERRRSLLGCLLGCLCCTALLIVAFINPLCSLAVHSATTELDSYILLSVSWRPMGSFSSAGNGWLPPLSLLLF